MDNNYCQKLRYYRYYAGLYFVYAIDDHINSKAPSIPKPIMNGGWCCSIVLLLGVLEPSPLRGRPCKTGHLKFSLSDPFMILRFSFLFIPCHGTCGSTEIGWSSDKLVLWSHKRLNKYLPLCWSAALLSHTADMPVLLLNREVKGRGASRYIVRFI